MIMAAIKHPITVKSENSYASNIQEDKAQSSTDRYRQEWLNILTCMDKNPEYIRELAFEGHLQTSKFRSVYWSLLLRVLSEDCQSWPLHLSLQRKRYHKLTLEFLKNPHEADGIDVDDPLSQSSKSVWNQYFSDQELFAVIRQDVVRTFPGVDFFRKPDIQNVMTNILFYYAREHPYMCYRQGMHEIVAPVLFVMYGDHQSFLHFKEIAKNKDIDEILMDVLNPKYLEADSYFIFSRIMASIESYYRVSNVIMNNVETTSDGFTSPSCENGDYNSEVEVVAQLNLIRDTILAKADLHLHNYLIKLDIPLHIFGIRWLRLLFGREFALLDLLVVWDAIFADSDRFDLPNYIVVAMLIRIRDKLLLSDYTTCLTYLMRYPPNVDINLILKHALHLQSPKKYEQPSNAFVYFTIPSSSNRIAEAKDDMQPSNYRALLMERQITRMQTRNAADEALMARLKSASKENRLAIDGYKDNNPDLLNLELKNMQSVLMVARSKLQTYLRTLRHHLPRELSPDVVASLDGIEELCKVLDTKLLFPLHPHTGQIIDLALEANEQQRQNKDIVLDSSKDTLDLSTDSNSITNCPFSSGRETSDHVSTYERPDNGFNFDTSRLLGNIKEIELIPIVSDENIAKSSNTISGGTSSIGGLPVADPLGLKND